jgi:hypothetical protein
LLLKSEAFFFPALFFIKRLFDFSKKNNLKLGTDGILASSLLLKKMNGTFFHRVQKSPFGGFRGLLLLCCGLKTFIDMRFGLYAVPSLRFGAASIPQLVSRKSLFIFYCAID